MKNTRFIFILLVGLFCLLLAISCTQDDQVNPVQNFSGDDLKTSTWKITSFIDSGKDETYHFNGYSFTFSDNGNLTATNGNSTINGTWTIDTGNSQDDSPEDVDLVIFFNVQNDFEELNEDWQIISQSETRLEFIHVSGGNGGTDTLIFEKA